uniref:Uncharacterized protein n=1 Tax=Helianthus annuus TaxID=4232 RepID=A0A251TA93_HELAN
MSRLCPTKFAWVLSWDFGTRHEIDKSIKFPLVVNTCPFLDAVKHDWWPSMVDYLPFMRIWKVTDMRLINQLSFNW